MADLTLAATDLALHDQALTANAVQVVVITAPPGSSSNLARLFNRGASPIFWRRGTMVSVGGANAYLLEAGASVDFRLPDLSDAKIALVSSSEATFTIQRRESSEVYRAAPGAGGGGGGSTDVSLLSKETTQGNVLAQLGASGQLHSDLGALHSDLLHAAIPLGDNVIGRAKMTDGTNVAAVKAASTAVTATDPALVVQLSPNAPLGAVPVTSLNNISTASQTGTALDNIGTRKSHTLQVDVTTTTAGTAGTHTIVLEGSLDGTYYTTLGTVTPASTSTVATDPSNHANVSVANVPYRFVRARNSAVPTSWVGTVTARVTSGV